MYRTNMSNPFINKRPKNPYYKDPKITYEEFARLRDDELVFTDEEKAALSDEELGFVSDILEKRKQRKALIGNENNNSEVAGGRKLRKTRKHLKSKKSRKHRKSKKSRKHHKRR